MTKFIDIFRRNILDLLPLIKEGRLTENYEGYRYLPQGDKVVTLLEGYSVIIEKLIDRIYDNILQSEKNYDRNYLRKKIDDFVINLFFLKENNKTPKIDEYFKELKKELRIIHSFFCAVFIQNLKISKEFKIGAVTFYPYSEKIYSDVFSDKGVKKPFPTKKDIKDKIRVYCFATCSVNCGTSQRAMELSEDMVETVLNVIRIFMPRGGFGIQGTLTSLEFSESSVYNLDEQVMTTSIQNKSVERYIDSTFSREEIDKNTIILKNIDTILLKEENQRSDMENKLIQAINWYGEIIKFPHDRKINLIKSCICFEVILIQDEKVKKHNISDRIAFLINDNKEKRIEISELINKIYNIRNRLIHDGKAKFKELDYNVFIHFLRITIFKVAERINKYSCSFDWKNLFDDVKFSGKPLFET